MQKSMHTKNIPVCNVEKPTTEEWTRGRHWHQTDTTEINRHKRFGQIKKIKKVRSLAEPGLNSTQCACHSKAKRFKTGNGHGARSMCGLSTGGSYDASAVSSKYLGIFVKIYIPLSRVVLQKQ